MPTAQEIRDELEREEAQEEQERQEREEKEKERRRKEEEEQRERVRMEEERVERKRQRAELLAKLERDEKESAAAAAELARKEKEEEARRKEAERAREAAEYRRMQEHEGRQRSLQASGHGGVGGIVAVYVRSRKVSPAAEEEEEDDPSYVPDKEEESTPKAKGKGKGKKVAARMVGMKGQEKCSACRGKPISCEVDMAAVERWEADVAAGATFTKAPNNAGCVRCKNSKHTCILPRTEALRAVIVPAKRKRGGGSALGSGDAEEDEAADEKPAKRVKVKMAAAEEKVPLWAQKFLQLGERIGRQIKRVGDYQKRGALALEYLVEVYDGDFKPPTSEESERWMEGEDEDCETETESTADVAAAEDVAMAEE